ncbi:MAG: hypothetical protein QJR06_07130 [Alicyclobacillaceae bacterium]|nr:hypothetical protein [Alicyclobacillaceae bacterium]
MNLKVVLPGIVILPRQTVVVLEQVFHRGDGTFGAAAVFSKTEHIRYEFSEQIEETSAAPQLSGKNYVVDYCRVTYGEGGPSTLIQVREIHVGAH